MVTDDKKIEALRYKHFQCSIMKTDVAIVGGNYLRLILSYIRAFKDSASHQHVWIG